MHDGWRCPPPKPKLKSQPKETANSPVRATWIAGQCARTRCPLDLIEPARLRASQLEGLSQLDQRRASSTFRASSNGLEPARRVEPARCACQLDPIEPARWGSSWLDGSSQLDHQRASSISRASSSGLGPARQVEPARSRPGQLEKSSWRDRVGPAPAPGHGKAVQRSTQVRSGRYLQDPRELAS